MQWMPGIASFSALQEKFVLSFHAREPKRLRQGSGVYGKIHSDVSEGFFSISIIVLVPIGCVHLSYGRGGIGFPSGAFSEP